MGEKDLFILFGNRSPFEFVVYYLSYLLQILLSYRTFISLLQNAPLVYSSRLKKRCNLGEAALFVDL